jgi:leucyl-tRNA synthetase
MGVPAHDTRDAALAEVRGVPSVNVIAKASKDNEGEEGGEGVLVNSGTFDGMRPSEARKAIASELKVSECCWDSGLGGAKCQRVFVASRVHAL